MAADSSFQTLDRLVAILDAFTVDQPHWTLNGLANELHLPCSSAHRYLHSLAMHGLLDCREDGSYVLGPKTLKWASIMQQTNGIARNTHRILLDLAYQTDATAFFVSECARDLVYQDVAVGNRGVVVSPNVGDRVLTYCMAAAQAIVAYWPQKRLDSLAPEIDSAYLACPHRHSPESWRARLARVRSEGYACGAQEPTVGGCMLAAPVLIGTNQIVGSIGIACLLDRCTVEDPEQVMAVKDAAKRLARYAQDNAGAEMATFR